METNAYTAGLNDVLQIIKHKYGYDFTMYAQASLQRRVAKFMEENKIETLYDLKFSLTNDVNAFNHFLQTVTVNVTELFRDPLFYKSLRENVLPLLSSYPIIKIWHAGCSTGEEVFSMCILLHEMGLLSRTKIYATDLNPTNLEKARAGIIPLRNMKEYVANYVNAGGTGDFADYYTARYNHALIKKELWQNVVFSQHNLVTDGVFNEFQLVLCRNVMIYFDKQLQNRVLNLFYESLAPLGFVALGIKESIVFSSVVDKFDEVAKSSKIYRRKD